MLLHALIACQGPPDPAPITEIGNPERSIGVAAFEPPASVGATTVDSAWGAFNGTKLVLDEQYAGEEELEWETPELVADLLAGPVELTFRSPNAAYNRVVLRPKHGRDGPADAPPELEDGSFVFEGSRGDGVPFLLVSENEDQVDLVGDYALDREQTHLALGFAVDAWVERLDLDAADVSGGTIRIDRDHNQALLAQFDAALVDMVTLAQDVDEDGVVGDGDLVLLD